MHHAAGQCVLTADKPQLYVKNWVKVRPEDLRFQTAGFVTEVQQHFLNMLQTYQPHRTFDQRCVPVVDTEAGQNVLPCVDNFHSCIPADHVL